ncbi:H-NS family nucleoid-associated regulatory protein [Caballeronia sp. 15715]|uniref:H-NS family nucleoid-associated regulatory protein n=1 Tax=unclassified Caballeronia TaxID=2646786 RepID=UPI0039E569D8
MRTLEQIQEKLAILQSQAEKLIAQKSQIALDNIRALMLEHGLTTEDIEAKAKEKREVAASKRAIVKTASASPTKDLRKGPFPVKYFDPKTGKSWTGRGRAPAWLATTRSKNKFLVDGAATPIETAGSADVATTPESSAKKPSSASVKKSKVEKAAAKSTLPAKYLDRKTGKSWSGRGSAPAWLANARNKNRFLVEGAEPSNFGTPAKTREVAKAAQAPESLDVTVSSKKAAKKAVATKKDESTGSQPPKYLDPVTGKTWSGRGPAPAWLAAVEDRNVYLSNRDTS